MAEVAVAITLTIVVLADAVQELFSPPRGSEESSCHAVAETACCMEAVARARVADQGRRIERSHEARVANALGRARVLHGSFQFFVLGSPPGCEHSEPN